MRPVTGVSMSETIVVTDDTTREELLEIHEARVRRLMAERANLPEAWPHRERRAELSRQIEDAFVEWDAARG